MSWQGDLLISLGMDRENKFSVGDTVMIRCLGLLYPSYSAMARVMKLTNWIKGKETFNLGPYEVVARKKHMWSHSEDILYGIRHKVTGEEFLIGEKGIIKGKEK